MPPLAPGSEMDAEALSRRVDATCCGHYKVEVGHVVEHYISERVYVVTHVHEWWGDSRDVGGGEIEVLELNARTGLPLKTIESAASDDEPSDGEPPDDWPRTTEDVYLFRGTWVKQKTLNRWLSISGPGVVPPPAYKEFGAESASFCECCNVYFDPDFVTWGWDQGGRERYFYEPTYRGRLQKCGSMCARCKHDHPQGRVLWRWLKAQMRARAVALYLYRLAHAPRYLARLYIEMTASMDEE